MNWKDKIFHDFIRFPLIADSYFRWWCSRNLSNHNPISLDFWRLLLPLQILTISFQGVANYPSRLSGARRHSAHVIARNSLAMWSHAQVLTWKKVLNLITVVLQHRHVSYRPLKYGTCDQKIVMTGVSQPIIAQKQLVYPIRGQGMSCAICTLFRGGENISCFIINDICYYVLLGLTVIYRHKTAPYFKTSADSPFAACTFSLFWFLSTVFKTDIPLSQFCKPFVIVIVFSSRQLITILRHP